MLHTGLRERRPVDRALAAYLRERKHLGARDRRLISEIVYGVFRWWGWLQRLAPPPGAAPDDARWSALLLAAAVMEAVDDRTLREFWRRACGIEEELPATLLQSDRPLHRATALFAALGRRDLLPIEFTALAPAWALALIRSPKPAADLVGWLQKRPPLWLRVQSADAAAVLAELREAGLEPAPHARLAGALRLDRTRVNLFTLPAYRARRVEVQDLSSQCVGLVCAPRPGERWWDACAGGGGKALLLAQLLRGRGTVVATDIREHKLQEVRHRARLAGFQNITTRAWNGRAVAPRQATFDGVLVDAPCSGSGTWRRNPWARWSLRPEDLAELNALQQRILRNAATGVKPGGVLVYATCSMFAAENDDVVKDFLSAHPAFTPEPFAHPLRDGQTDGALRLWPWDGDGDAMYLMRLRKSG